MHFNVLSSQQLQELENRFAARVEEIIRNSQRKAAASKEWLTAKEVCEQLKISNTTLHVWAKEGRIKKHVSGSRIRFRQDDILEVFQQLETKKGRV